MRYSHLAAALAPDSRNNLIKCACHRFVFLYFSLSRGRSVDTNWSMYQRRGYQEPFPGCSQPRSLVPSQSSNRPVQPSDTDVYVSMDYNDPKYLSNSPLCQNLCTHKRDRSSSCVLQHSSHRGRAVLGTGDSLTVPASRGVVFVVERWVESVRPLSRLIWTLLFAGVASCNCIYKEGRLKKEVELPALSVCSL